MLPKILAIPFSKKDEKLIEQIYEMYYGTMMSVSISILKDHALAEDAVAEAFLKINRHLGKLHEISSHQTRGYIVSIVRTTSLDLYNKRERRKEDMEDISEYVPDKSINILDDLLSQDSYDSLKKIIQFLPEHLDSVDTR